MVRSEYQGDTEQRFAVVELRNMKMKIDRDRRRESDEDTREALGRRSATEFLRERS